VSATWLIRDATGRPMGQCVAPTAAAALALAAERRPYAPWPLAVQLLAGAPDPTAAVHPTKRPSALAKRAATMAKNAAARRAAEAAMPPGQRAWHQRQRKRKQGEKWRRYYLAKLGELPPPASR
jgi:hypothetical protein